MHRPPRRAFQATKTETRCLRRNIRSQTPLWIRTRVKLCFFRLLARFHHFASLPTPTAALLSAVFMGRNMWEQIVGKGVEIRAIATGRRNRHSYTPIEAEFVQVFRTDMLPFTGEYTKKLKRPQKTAIVQELGKAEEEARRLKADGYSAEQILEELKIHYSAEAIRERLNLPPFEAHSAQPHSPAAGPSDRLHLYERTGETPAPSDLIDPHDLYSGGSQHSLAKQQRRRGEVPGYGESWTARKAAIYGMSL